MTTAPSSLRDFVEAEKIRRLILLVEVITHIIKIELVKRCTYERMIPLLNLIIRNLMWAHSLRSLEFMEGPGVLADTPDECVLLKNIWTQICNWLRLHAFDAKGDANADHLDALMLELSYQLTGIMRSAALAKTLK